MLFPLLDNFGRVMVNYGRRWNTIHACMVVGVLVATSCATNVTNVSFIQLPEIHNITSAPINVNTSTTATTTSATTTATTTSATSTATTTSATTTATTTSATTNATASTTSTKRAPLPPLPKRPHVILMVADDLGWNDVPWNNAKVVSPHLGKLAKGGVVLNQSYVLPTCTPTRAALLSGRYPFTYGMQKGALDPLEPRGVPLRIELLPQALRKRGYSTHAIGKWHLGFCDWRYTPIHRGFDSFYGFFTGAEDYYTHSRGEKASRKKGWTNTKKYEPLDLWNNTTPDKTKDGVYSTYLFASAAEDLIRSRDPKNPLFLYLPFQSVHAPLQVPKNYTKVFRHVKNFFRRNYLGMVLAMDDAVGRVVAALKATGHYENSVIIFTTDNGGSIKMGASNWPLRGAKANLLEGGTRGPAFIHSPHLPNPGTVSNQLFHVTDWFNTIVSLAGKKPSRKLDSYDQWYALAGLSVPPRKEFVYNIDDTVGKFRAAVRFNDMKLSVGRVGNKAWQPLYPERYEAKSQFYILPQNYSDDAELYDYVSLDLIASSESMEMNSTQPDIFESMELFHFNSKTSNNSNFQEDSDQSSLSTRQRLPLSTLFSGRKKSQAKQVKSKSKNQNKRPHVKTDKNNSKPKNKLMFRKPLIRDKEHQCEDKGTQLKQKYDNSYSKPNSEQEKIEKQKLRWKKKRKKVKRKKKKTPTESELNFRLRFKEHTKWKDIKNLKTITWDPHVVQQLERFFVEKTKIRLYNITDDPGETKDISKDNFALVQTVLIYLSKQFERFVPMKPKRVSVRGNPNNWGDVWTPGWCQAH